MASVQMSEKLLVALVAAVASLCVALLTIVSTSFFVDANTERQTDVQMIELALGLLQSDAFENEHTAQIMRNWAVSTINASAQVKFDDAVARALIDGGFPDDVYFAARANFWGRPISPDVAAEIQRAWDDLD